MQDDDESSTFTRDDIGKDGRIFSNRIDRIRLARVYWILALLRRARVLLDEGSDEVCDMCQCEKKEREELDVPLVSGSRTSWS